MWLHACTGCVVYSTYSSYDKKKLEYIQTRACDISIILTPLSHRALNGNDSNLGRIRIDLKSKIKEGCDCLSINHVERTQTPGRWLGVIVTPLCNDKVPGVEENVLNLVVPQSPFHSIMYQ